VPSRGLRRRPRGARLRARRRGALGRGGRRVAVLLKPDLILLDIRMDGINGFEASRRILALQPETIVVLVSAWADEAPSASSAAARRRRSTNAI
jgi:Response regulator containing CheY-like receiver domain and AraC-type DNA-binding domain